MRKSPVKSHKWTYEEERAVVEFISISKSDPKYDMEERAEWPSFRDGHCFWTDAAIHIKTSTAANILLASMYKPLLFKCNLFTNFHWRIVFSKICTVIS